LNFIKKLARTDLFKITSLNSLGIIIRLFFGLITSKVMAIFVGPSGMALMGNFRNFVGSFETISTLGFQNGIVKYIAENKAVDKELKKQVSTIVISILFVSLILSGLLFVFSDYCNELIFGNNYQYAFIFKAFAFALPWYALSLILVSIINGFEKFKSVIYINIIGNFIGLIVSVFFITQYKITGALLSIIITPSLMFFISFYYINKEISLINFVRFQFYDFKIIKNLSSYFLMALVSGVVGSVVFIAIRNNIITTIGIQQAGYWEAISKLSNYYLVFISSILSLYFLPKLAVANNNQDSKKVFWSFYKTIFPAFILGLIVIFFLRSFIVKLLFTNEFLPVTELFFWQLAGDVFKVASLILGYQFFAKKLTIAFIISELLSLGVLYFLSIYLIKAIGLQGIVMAQAVDNFIYLLVLGIYFRKSLF
jgi:O-antigen/teichoic acid export membrane protein